MLKRQLSEGLQMGDLEYLVHNSLHFDEFNSKMGQAEDIVTMSFLVKDHMPAQDLVSFIESGYDWVLDADVSTGEIADGKRMVFVEMQRDPENYDQINELLADLDYLTGIKREQWNFRWFKQDEYVDFNEDNFRSIVPTSPTNYQENVERFIREQKQSKQLRSELDNLKKLSGLV